jgi:hypothetical protein
MAAMRRPRFQFRLSTVFALTALVGWAVVVLPHWSWEFRLYRQRRAEEERMSQAEEESRQAQKESKEYWEGLEREWGVIPCP